MRKSAVCALAAIILAAMTSAGALAAAAETPVSVIVDDAKLSFDVQPRIVNDRVLVPMRGIFEAMGATALWNGNSKTVTALRLDSVIKITIGSVNANVNNESRLLDVPAQISDGSTFIPLRFVSESMGAEVEWDGSTRTVTITTDKAHWSDSGDNLSVNLLFSSEWIDMDSGDKTTFDPDRFIQINDSWSDDPEGLYYSYSETYEPERNMIGLFLDGAYLKDHYFVFDPETRILSEVMLDEVLTRLRIAD
jgi:hypothetical protein